MKGCQCTITRRITYIIYKNKYVVFHYFNIEIYVTQSVMTLGRQFNLIYYFYIKCCQKIINKQPFKMSSKKVQ